MEIGKRSGDAEQASPTPMCSEEFQLQRSLPMIKGYQTHTGIPSPGFQCQEGKSPLSDYKKQQELWLSEMRAQKSPAFLLKVPHMNLLAVRLICSVLHLWGSKTSRDVLGGTELSGLRVRAGGLAFFQTEKEKRESKELKPYSKNYNGRGHCSFVEPSPTQPGDRGGATSESSSTWLTPFSPP